MVEVTAYTTAEARQGAAFVWDGFRFDKATLSDDLLLALIKDLLKQGAINRIEIKLEEVSTVAFNDRLVITPK